MADLIEESFGVACASARSSILPGRHARRRCPDGAGRRAVLPEAARCPGRSEDLDSPGTVALDPGGQPPGWAFSSGASVVGWSRAASQGLTDRLGS